MCAVWQETMSLHHCLRRYRMMRTFRWFLCRSGGFLTGVLVMCALWLMHGYSNVPDGAYEQTSQSRLMTKIVDALNRSGTHVNQSTPYVRHEKKHHIPTFLMAKNAVEKHILNFSAILEDVRDKVYERRFIWDSDGYDFRTSKIARPSLDNYFDIIDKYSDITTVRLELPFAAVQSIANYSRYNSTLTFDGGYFSKLSAVEYNEPWASNAINAIKSLRPFHVDDYGLALGKEDVTKPGGKVTVSHLHMFPGGVVTADGDVWFQDIVVRPGGCKEYRLVHYPDIRTMKSHNEVFSLAMFWGDGYYTFTAEALPRVMPYVMFLRQHSTIRIHVTKAEPFVLRYLTFLGIGGVRVITGMVKARILYVPMAMPCREPRLYPSQLLASYFQSAIALDEKNDGKKDQIVVIRRSPGKDRYLRQYPQILSAVKKVGEEFGLETVEFKDNPIPSMLATRSMFRRAAVIIGAHGAGLTNMMLTPPGSLVVEVVCHNPNLIYCYAHQAGSMGHLYAGVLPTNDCLDTTPHDVTWVLKDFLLNMRNGKVESPALLERKKEVGLRW